MKIDRKLLTIRMSGRGSAAVLKDVQDTLATAEYGLRDLIAGPPPRKLAGLRNLVVFGRAVTNVLQNLRPATLEFDDWYRDYQDEMKTDELMNYFYRLRSEILKQGVLKKTVHVHIRHLDMPQDLSRFGPPPQNAKAFFIGDQNGGTGWEVQLSDGSVEKYYAELPSDIGSASLHFPDPPQHHLGRRLEDLSIEALSRQYFEYLSHLVEAAKRKFL